jgi:maltose alpha-D-glucosyltransferase/alpha-amylase
LYQRSLYQSLRSHARATIETLRSEHRRLEDDVQVQASRVLSNEAALYSILSELTRDLIDAWRIRCHGDLHLRQVLFTGKDFVVLDFEGDPERPVSERRIKSSPLRDVARMLRSFHDAAHTALRERTPSSSMQHAAVTLEDWTDYWSAWVCGAFLRMYLHVLEASSLMPKNPAQLETLIRAFILEQSLDELRFELTHRPERAHIPLKTIGHYCTNRTDHGPRHSSRTLI